MTDRRIVEGLQVRIDGETVIHEGGITNRAIVGITAAEFRDGHLTLTLSNGGTVTSIAPVQSLMHIEMDKPTEIGDERWSGYWAIRGVTFRMEVSPLDADSVDFSLFLYHSPEEA